VPSKRLRKDDYSLAQTRMQTLEISLGLSNSLGNGNILVDSPLYNLDLIMLSRAVRERRLPIVKNKHKHHDVTVTAY
jgi:hypothetical protein